GHGDDHGIRLGGPRDVPRGGETQPVGGAVVLGGGGLAGQHVVRGADHELRAGAGHRPHGAGGEVDTAQQVVDGVGDDDVVPHPRGDVVREEAQAVRFAEGGGVGGTVGTPALAGADGAHEGLAVGSELDEAVAAGVGEEEVAA